MPVRSPQLRRSHCPGVPMAKLSFLGLAAGSMAGMMLYVSFFPCGEILATDDGQRVNEVAEAGKIGHVVMRHFRYIDHGILGGSIPFLTGDETGKTIFAETIAAECGGVNQLRSHAGIAVQLAPPLQEFVTEPFKRINTALCLVVMQIDARSFDQIAIPGGAANVPASFRFAQRLVKFTEIKK